MHSRRAGCSGTGTSGSEGGGEETTSRKADTAPRRPPYTCRCPAKPPATSSKSSAAANEHGSIILTTNRGIASWGEIFEDTTVAAAILDRLLHHATVLQIDGESYRMRGHRARLAQLRSGLNHTPQGGEFS